MVFGAGAALLLVPALLMLQEPERGASESHRAPEAYGSMWSVLRIPTLWWIIASGALLNFSMYAIGTFLPAFLSRVHGLSLAKSGIATGVVYLSGGVSGGTLAGYLGDFIVQRREDGRLLCAAVMALVAIPFACVGILQPAPHRQVERRVGASRRGPGGFRHGHGNFPRHWPSASHADYSGPLHSARVCALHGLAHYHHGHSAAGSYRRRGTVTPDKCQKLV